MIYLTDNDIIQKLAICDLLDQTVEAYNASKSDVYILSTLKFRFAAGNRRQQMVKKYGEEAVDRLLHFIEEVREITDLAPEDQLTFEDTVGIDPGETVILSATSLFPSYRLLTGDKRCLKALATSPECRTVALRVQGNIICFEQVLRRLIEQFGFEHVLAKVVPVSYCDTALRATFGSGMQSTVSNVVDGLDSYIRELRELPINLLIDGY